jgi:molybdate transport system ATP-binding protein
MNRGQGLRLNLSLQRQTFALRVDLTLPAQGITVIFGPSGSGKTSLLRCVAGLEPCAGLIAIGDEA